MAVAMTFGSDAGRREAYHLCGCLRPTREEQLRLKELHQEAEDGTAGLPASPALLKRLAMESRLADIAHGTYKATASKRQSHAPGAQEHYSC